MTLSPSEAIVLAGGAGTRLRPVLPGVPKVLAPIGGKPFLHLLLEWLAAQGIRSAVLATGYAAEQVERSAAMAGGSFPIVFSRETTPLGTGGAIARAFDHIRGDRAWVLNGDSFCDADLHAVASEAADAPEDPWLVATQVPDAARYGTLLLKGSRVEAYLEKTGRAEQGWINAGVYLLPRGIVPQGASSIERDLFPAWAEQGRLRAARGGTRFIDIGTPESFAAAAAFFS